MANPDPEKFAKVVLWHLAGLRADIVELQSMVAEQAGIPPEEAQTRWKSQHKILQSKLYLEALAEVGLQDSPEPPPPPTNDPDRN